MKVNSMGEPPLSLMIKGNARLRGKMDRIELEMFLGFIAIFEGEVVREKSNLICVKRERRNESMRSLIAHRFVSTIKPNLPI